MRHTTEWWTTKDTTMFYESLTTIASADVEYRSTVLWILPLWAVTTKQRGQGRHSWYHCGPGFLSCCWDCAGFNTTNAKDSVIAGKDKSLLVSHSELTFYSSGLAIYLGAYSMRVVFCLSTLPFHTIRPFLRWRLPAIERLEFYGDLM